MSSHSDKVSFEDLKDEWLSPFFGVTEDYTFIW